MKFNPGVIAFLLCLAVLATSCKKNRETMLKRDFGQIRKEGVIRAATLAGSMSYFTYKGEEMGYEYELLTGFAEDNQLNINLTVAKNEAQLFELLDSCLVDIIVYNLPVTLPGKEKYRYCGREVITEQVLVQPGNNKNALITDVTQLEDKNIWVIHDSKYYSRLVNLDKEIGGGIRIRTIEKDTITTEDLIEMVSEGRIPYTVSDNDLAKLNKTYYSNINTNLKISHPQRSSWAVRKDMPQLAKAVNSWFQENENTPSYMARTKRYFELSKLPGDAPVPIISSRQISPYDDLFKHYATALNWDWRLLASIAYQESKFHTDRVSWAGAIGLMGLMPRTAEAYGTSRKEIYLPEPSIRAASGLIKTLIGIFSNIQDEQERIKFVLAAYNAGAGHVYDAQALTKKYGKNPRVWDEVEEYLKLISIPDYYNDPVVKHGYFRSKETIVYVRSVMERWHYYQKEVP